MLWKKSILGICIIINMFAAFLLGSVTIPVIPENFFLKTIWMIVLIGYATLGNYLFIRDYRRKYLKNKLQPLSQGEIKDIFDEADFPDHFPDPPESKK